MQVWEILPRRHTAMEKKNLIREPNKLQSVRYNQRGMQQKVGTQQKIPRAHLYRS